MRGRLTTQQEQFARLVAEGHSFVGAYRKIYPPRNGTRSAGAEQVAARRLAHRPLVERRVGELREQLLASDSVEMRRRAQAVLGRILAERLDPRYRRTAMDVLHYLDERDRAATIAGWEAYRAAAAQITALDAIEAGTKNRTRSPSARARAKAVARELKIVGVTDEGTNELDLPLTPEAAQDAERRRDEIDQVIADRRRMRHGEAFELRPAQGMDFLLGDAPEPAPVKEEGFQWAQKPGRFGKGSRMRLR
jgi:hypothetical protein